jgi:ribosomal protein S18 acetylase RimI-like enzyme
MESAMLSIRFATRTDVPLLKKFIHELAEYEGAPNAVLLTEEHLLQDGFGPEPKFRAILAEENAQPAGYALFFSFYSTWTGSSVFLEDLFVRPSFRGRGVGKALLSEVARIAKQQGGHRIRLDVLDSNTPAIEFYKSLGAQFLDEWRNVAIRADAFDRLAGSSRLGAHP